MKAAIITYPGTQASQSTADLLEKLGAQVDIIKSRDSLSGDYDLIVLADGSAYDDAVRPGAIAKNDPVSKQLADYLEKGTSLIGIGNGFQILTELHLLPGYFMPNDSLSYVAGLTPVNLNEAIFSQADEPLDLSIAHKAGNYQLSDQELAELKEHDGILMTYAQDVNGSRESIAGVVNADKTVFGLMPLVDRHQDADITSDVGVTLLTDILNQKGLL